MAALAGSSTSSSRSTDGESSDLDYCLFCTAKLDPSKLVVDIKTGAVTVSCPECGKLNISGEIQKCFIQPSSVVPPSTAKRAVGKTVLPCPVCHKTFHLKTGLSKHVLGVHTNGSTSLPPTTASPLVIHSRGKSFKCKHCGKKFTNNSNLTRHIRLHTGIKSFECKYCNKNFSRHDHLILHTRTHLGEKPFKCNLCGKQFIQSNHLNQHTKTRCQATCKFKKKCFSKTEICFTLCDTQFHTGEKHFGCDHCGRKYFGGNQLNKHIR